MIDFRYHIVSLISVFVALAVGLLLGAGLLQGRLGEVLTNEVDNLRTSRAEMRVELDEAIRHNHVQQQVMEQLSQTYLPNSLNGVTVATIALPGALDTDVDATITKLEEAGATLTAQAHLTPALTAAENASFVKAYAPQLQRYLSGEVSGDYQIFAQAIIEALTGDATGKISEDTKLLIDLLEAAEKPIIQVSADPAVVASSLVVIGPRSILVNPGDPEPEFTDEELAQMANTRDAYATLLDQASNKVPTVVYASALTEHDVLWHIRDLAFPKLTTVDQSLENSATLAIPLALKAARKGQVSDYGDDHGAEAFFPPVAGDIVKRGDAPKIQSDADKRRESESEAASPSTSETESESESAPANEQENSDEGESDGN